MEPSETIRLRITVHYDGSSFHGWQFQPHQRTVQGDLQAALARLADGPVTVVGSGRTDTGVHASGQVAAFDMPASWTPEQLRKSLNAVLPRDIWIESAERVGNDFHPRYHALRRTYSYRVGTSDESASPFHRRWCWPLGLALDAALLDAAAASLLGMHSFEAFAKTGQPHRGTRCRVDAASWHTWDLGVQFEVTANRYLHHMVRYLVGTMVDVARGRRPIADVPALLAGAPDQTTSPPAPAEGLFLARVEYPVTTTFERASEPETPRSEATA